MRAGSWENHEQPLKKKELMLFIYASIKLYACVYVCMIALMAFYAVFLFSFFVEQVFFIASAM